MTALSVILAQAASEQVSLSFAGAVMMTLCVGLVLGLNIFCLTRILRPAKPSQHHHAPQEIDTHDLDT
jgi:hypothetical protein